MKIAISMYCKDFNEDTGDTVRAKRVFEILSKEYQVILLTTAFGKQDSDSLVNIHHRGWNLRLIPVLLRNKFDCIYCSNDWRGFVTYYLFSKVCKYKIIFEAHGIMSQEFSEVGAMGIRPIIGRFLERLAIKRADFVVAVSENTFEYYKKYNKNIALIRVFVDEAVFKVNREKLQERVGRSNFKQVGLIGPFDIAANKYFLEFLYNNLDKFSDRIRFVAIGRCNDRIKSEKVMYTSYLGSIQDYVNQLSCVDAILIPSKIATTGPLNKILESMSCSLPVFTTPKGMVGLYHFQPGKDILVFDENMLVNKVNELLFDEELMKRVSENARNVIERHYSRKVTGKKLREALKELFPEKFNS